MFSRLFICTYIIDLVQKITFRLKLDPNLTTLNKIEGKKTLSEDAVSFIVQVSKKSTVKYFLYSEEECKAIQSGWLANEGPIFLPIMLKGRARNRNIFSVDNLKGNFRNAEQLTGINMSGSLPIFCYPWQVHITGIFERQEKHWQQDTNYCRCCIPSFSTNREDRHKSTDKGWLRLYKLFMTKLTIGWTGQWAQTTKWSILWKLWNRDFSS